MLEYLRYNQRAREMMEGCGLIKEFLTTIASAATTWQGGPKSGTRSYRDSQVAGAASVALFHS